MMNIQNRAPIRIAIDTNIPMADAFLPMELEKVYFSGRDLCASDLKDVDVLWVRSVTKVNKNLLDGTNIKYVGTATAGTNHLDIPYLESKGIAWCSAPGSNAISVADYICSCFAVLYRQGLIDKGFKVGLLGHGHVGQCLAPRLRALGFVVKVFDPLRRLIHPEEDLCELDELYDCQVLSAHVPLTQNVPFATRSWIDRDFLEKFPRGLIFINSARGEIMKQNDVLDLKANGHLASLILDVFESEPSVSARTFELADLLTPHIAGYSWTGKLRGTEMLAEQLCKWIDTEKIYPRNNTEESLFNAKDIWDLILQVYDVRCDDQKFRMANLNLGDSTTVFDPLRKNYPKRLEFGDYRCKIPAEWQAQALALGFVLNLD